MKKLILFFAVIFFLQRNIYGFNRNRILNDSAVPEGLFFFLSKLDLFVQGYGSNESIETGICSATIISKRHILTAAHCVNSDDFIRENSTTTKWNYRIQSIVIYYREKGKEIIQKLKFLSIHTKYFFNSSFTTDMFADIAVIEFPEGTDLKIPPITLASNYVEKESDMAIAAGYGIYKWHVNKTIGKQYPESLIDLQNVTVSVHVNPDYSNPTIIATSSYEKYANEGDSGGPLMIERNGKFYQIGIAAIVLKINESFVSNFYARLSFYCDWISKVTTDEVKCQPLPKESNVPSKKSNHQPLINLSKNLIKEASKDAKKKLLFKIFVFILFSFIAFFCLW